MRTANTLIERAQAIHAQAPRLSLTKAHRRALAADPELARAWHRGEPDPAPPAPAAPLPAIVEGQRAIARLQELAAAGVPEGQARLVAHRELAQGLFRPGAEPTAATVVTFRQVADFAPGAVAPRHSHPGQEFIYVLEGSVIQEPDGMAAQTVKAGETTTQPPHHAHMVKNSSATEPARVLVFMTLGKGEPLAIPAK